MDKVRSLLYFRLYSIFNFGLKMKKILCLSITGFLLAACGTMSTTALFKPGATTTQKQRDLDQCKIASFRAIPQEFTTTTSGGFYQPGDMSCRTHRNGRVECYRVGGMYVPPSSFTVDQNGSLRWRFVQGCLQKKGYNIINNLRPCANAADRQRAMNARNMSDMVCNPDAKLDY